MQRELYRQLGYRLRFVWKFSFFFSDYHFLWVYCNDPEISDTQKICCNHSKVWTMWLYHRIMSPKDADRMTNSVDLDQTAPLGAVWSGSALFAQACLSENLRSLRYYTSRNVTKQAKWVCAHPPSLIRVFAQWVAKDPSFLHADSEGSDQTGQMPRLIWVFAGRRVILLFFSCRGSYNDP